ncbi:nodulation-signaling pathway 2 protein-like [Forsythia ovata]|uniref:Nodulation-signaling pathway 2 protein-like n=1 Tax=Forsythia ovata TaxID=205694 RepID=A0ABD1WCM3_9LAMI
MDGLEIISSREIADICGWINESDCEGKFSTPVTMEGDEWSTCISVESSENSLKENQGDYLRQESVKNFREAFKAFYQGLPYGRFPPFTANSAILEAKPDDAATMHIVDFDIGEGIQWPPVIEAMGRMPKALRVTLIKSDDECSSPC